MVLKKKDINNATLLKNHKDHQTNNIQFLRIFNHSDCLNKCFSNTANLYICAG